MTTTKPSYYVTEWIETPTRGPSKGKRVLRRYETKSLTPMHASIRERWPAKTTPVTIVRGPIPMAVHGDPIGQTPSWTDAFMAMMKERREAREASAQQQSFERAQAAADVLSERIVDAERREADGDSGAYLQTLADALMEYRRTGKLTK